MRAFTRGVIVGIGVGLLIAPMTGEELRRLLNERFTELRNSLPPDANQYVRQVSERVSMTSDNLRGYAQEAVSRVKDAGNALGDLAQRSVQEVKRTGQDLADTTRTTTQSVKSNTSVQELTS
jgi:gas vesicle protein